MSTEPANYEAVLADLEAKKAQIENAITVIRSVMNLGLPGFPSPSGPSGGAGTSVTPQHDAFLGLSIPEAAKKHLTAVRRKLSTQDIMTALEAGGLPKSKYQTVYGVLRRRQETVGDILNVDGDWALASWYPNRAAQRIGKKADTGETAEQQSITSKPEESESEDPDVAKAV
jgi:hypothetical protein